MMLISDPISSTRVWSLTCLRQLLLVAVAALGVLGCSTPPPSAPDLPAERFAGLNDVVLLPTDDFSFDFAAQLARMLASDTSLRVRAVLNLGAKDWRPYSNAPQYDPARLKQIALPAIAELKKTYGGSVYIILTTRDINNSSGNLSFVFSETYPLDKISVISAARMLGGADGRQANIQLVGERLRKMSLRAIGFLYHGLPRTSDPRDLMYSPLMSLEALDMIDLSRKGNPRERS